ncbi:low molecular weight phosphatase family protein [Allorhodopirellula heiligendammensis]|uniref:Low molecular weight protein-tyrosine-phosphatase YwlE n=1 Tax=Allorhodopirellula heiligendammensis TaxID=2714739 RepID=A0A5C6BU80_9BACT|nr:low molecular weight phosphatase family protein [Allorhodopirellula heiligendammensis]TWU15588.1 Low molecular weight protein-tyrosine-phosphatase YwlE [Allorhodopirellula heiligendammensis]
MNKLLFLCTGNYYRSRFAEMYFRHLAAQRGLDWEAESRGLRLCPGNEGSLSCFTQQECARLGIAIEPMRFPQSLSEADLETADLTIAVKETEHRSLMQANFPRWENGIEYWEIHDIDVATADEAMPILRQHVEALVHRLADSATNP